MRREKRQRPGDFAPDWRTVFAYFNFAYFNQWSKDGTLERIYRELHRRWRKQKGRRPTPSAGIIDSQSVKTTEMGGERGFDGGKRLTGRKRHLMVDTEGLPVSVVVTAASVGDREAVLVRISPGHQAASRGMRRERCDQALDFRAG